MTAIPSDVIETIHIALVDNLFRLHRTYAGRTRLACLPHALTGALKWVHSQDPETAAGIALAALVDTAAQQDGPTLQAAAHCLRHSLHTARNQGEWTEAQADEFVTAALIHH